MTHYSALRAHAADRYLIGDLSEAERNAFEAHYLRCWRCAADLKLGEVFKANVRAVLKTKYFDREPSAAFLEMHPYEVSIDGAVRGAFTNPEAAFATARYEAVCVDLERQRLGKEGPPAIYCVRDRRTGERIVEKKYDR